MGGKMACLDFSGLWWVRIRCIISKAFNITIVRGLSGCCQLSF